MSDDKIRYGVGFSNITKGVSIEECTFQMLSLDTGGGGGGGGGALMFTFKLVGGN